MGLYSIHGNLATIGGNLIGTGNNLDEFLYLTYFRNLAYDPESHYDTDIPEIGPATLYTPANTYQITEINDPSPDSAYHGCPGLFINGTCTISEPNAAQHHIEPVIGPLITESLSAGRSVSIEAVVYNTTYWNRYREWAGISLNCASNGSPIGYISLGINVWNNWRGIGTGVPGGISSDNYVANDGFHIDWPDSGAVCMGYADDAEKRHKTGINHLALVIDKDRDEMRGYLNGELSITRKSAELSVTNLVIYNNLNDTVVFTQFAVRNGDCSTDAGASYPVPEQPYKRISA